MARLSLGWLKPPQVPADGVMSLGDHLREFRYRIVMMAVWVSLGTLVCAFFYQPILGFMLHPIEQAKAVLAGSHAELNVQAVLQGVASPLLFAFSVVMMAALVLTSPLWLYQVWAYLRPALLKHEKRYALGFLSAAVPLFVGGCALGYFVLPSAVVFMMSFTPNQISIMNQIPIDDFVLLMIRIMVVFGIGFLMPLIVVVLNLMGVVPGATLKKSRKIVIFGCFVFAALVTPSGDPIAMLMLSVPMMMLFFVAEGVCHLNDRRRAKRLAAADAAAAAETLERAAQLGSSTQ